MRRVLTTLALTAVLAGCWVQPGFDAGRTNANASEATLSSSTVAGLTERWDTVLPDVTDVNAPLSVGGSIYATAKRTTTAGAPRVFAVDPATGAVRWATALVSDWGAPDDVHAPAYQGDRLLVPWRIDGVNGGPGGLASVGLDGTVRDMPAGDATLGVALVGDSVIAHRWGRYGSSSAGFATIDWTYRPFLPDICCGEPRPGVGFAVVGDRIAWSHGTQALGFSAACPQSPVPGGGCAWDWATELGGLPAPATALGATQVVYGDASGTVSVLDMATGAVAWTAEVGAAITQRAAVAGGKILVATADGRVVALPAAGCGPATCSPLWEGTVGGAATAQPLVGGDVVYATTGSQIAAFALGGCGIAPCPALTTVTAPDAITGGPIVQDGLLIAGTQSGHLVAFGLE